MYKTSILDFLSSNMLIFVFYQLLQSIPLPRLPLFTTTANTRSPTQGTMLEAIPTLRPAYWEMIPVTHGIMIAPLLSGWKHDSDTGSSLVILPALATAVGSHACHGKGKGKQQQNRRDLAAPPSSCQDKTRYSLHPS